jgi:reactive intermediate/imine deaminase
MAANVIAPHSFEATLRTTTRRRTAMDQKQIIDTGWGYHHAWGFSQAIRVGALIFLAGQIPVDPDGNVLFEGDIRGQTRQSFENMKVVLEAAGSSLDDIVEIVSYHTDMADLDTMNEVKAEYLTRNLPVWTAVGVSGLALPGQMIEIKVVALARS